MCLLRHLTQEISAAWTGQMTSQSRRPGELVVLSSGDMRTRIPCLRNKAAVLGQVLSQEAAPEIQRKNPAFTPYLLAHFEPSQGLS